MLFLGKRFEDLNEDDFNQLVLNSVREGRSLEYKLELPGGKDADRREFLADVSAIANSGGGFIFYGIEATNGVAVAVPGLMVPSSVDETKLDFENRIRTGLQPRLVGLRINEFALRNGCHVVGLYIPQSLYAPHMVTFQESNKFYGRNSAGKYSMDVTEIRDRVLLSADLPIKMRAWTDERLSLINQDRGIFSIGSTTWLALHFVPAYSVSGRYDIPVSELKRHERSLLTFGSDVPTRRFNLEGLVAYRQDDKQVGTYTQLFRSGQLESLASARFLQVREEEKKITSVGFEDRLIGRANVCLALLRAIEVEPPVLIRITLNDVKGMNFHLPDYWPDELAQTGILQDRLDLPSIWIDDWEEMPNAGRLLRPAIDALWNAAGFEGSPNYDDDGNWVPRR